MNFDNAAQGNSNSGKKMALSDILGGGLDGPVDEDGKRLYVVSMVDRGARGLFD